MARPRVFVSSTYYDLKYIRASLEIFIGSLGFDAILSEKGDIAYTSDQPLDESCYREVENADIFTLIVGGRYGSEVSEGDGKPKEFFDRYESITKREYGAAVEKDIPVYVLIEKAVYAEYRTFVLNKDIKGINYAHVDSVNVFLLIGDILSRPRNNPVQAFEKFEDIESWLREQWAGLFRELLRRQSQQQQLTGLSQQVLQLKETNETLKKYLEAVMRGVGKQATSKLIKSEEERLSNIEQLFAFSRNPWVKYVTGRGRDIEVESVATAVRESTGFEDFADRVRVLFEDPEVADRILRTLRRHPGARNDFNKARRFLNLTPFEVPADWISRPDYRGDESAPRPDDVPAPDTVVVERVKVDALSKPAKKRVARRVAKVTHQTADA